MIAKLAHSMLRVGYHGRGTPKYQAPCTLHPAPGALTPPLLSLKLQQAKLAPYKGESGNFCLSPFAFLLLISYI